LDQERTIIAEQYKKESEERVEQVKTEIEARLAEEKARHANKEYELIKENKELLNTVEDARSEGERNRAERLADQVLLKTIILYWGIALLLAAIGIYFIVVAIDKSTDGSLTWLKLASESAPAMLDLLLSIIIGIADFVVIRKFLCDLDRESIRDRLIRRFMK
jgi:Fe2+ transport system protein B